MVSKLYRQLVDTVKEEAFKHAKYIYSVYGRDASHIYPSYRHVALDISSTLETLLDIPEEVIESILETEGLTAKLGAIALFSHVKDEDDE